MRSTFHHKKNLTIELITSMMVMLFVYTGISKLIAPETFLIQIKSAPYLGHYAHWLHRLIPFAELIIAMSLLFKNTRLAGYYAFAFLMVLFSIYITVLLLSGNPLPCSCGGVIRLMSWRQHLLFNCIFILLSFVVIKLHKKFRPVVMIL